MAPWLKKKIWSPMHPHHLYQPRDGLTIEGYLTPRKDTIMENAKNLPVVVNPGHGPHVTAGDIIRKYSSPPTVAMLFFKMNFGASTGYGRKFTELGYKQWGQTMQNDITDGVEWLIKRNRRPETCRPSTAEAMADMQHWQGSPLLLIFYACHRLCGCIQLVHLHADYPTLLETLLDKGWAKW